MSDDDTGSVIGAIVGIIVLIVICIYNAGDYSSSVSHKELTTQNEVSIQSVLADKELPVLSESLDVDNLRRKYEFLDKRGDIGWIYIITADGVLFSEEPVLNKLTSNGTYLTPMEQIDKSRASSDDPYTYFTYEMSDIDATYGTNTNGVFWFDPDGNYQELLLTAPTVLYSSERKTYNVKPLVQN